MFAVADFLAAIAKTRSAAFERKNKIKFRRDYLFTGFVHKTHLVVFDKTQQAFLNIIGTIIENERFIKNFLFLIDGHPAVFGYNVGNALLIVFHGAELLFVVGCNICRVDTGEKNQRNKSRKLHGEATALPHSASTA